MDIEMRNNMTFGKLRRPSTDRIMLNVRAQFWVMQKMYDSTEQNEFEHDFFVKCVAKW